MSLSCDPEVTKRPPLRLVRRRHVGRSSTSSCATESVHGSELESGVRMRMWILFLLNDMSYLCRDVPQALQHHMAVVN